MLKNCRIALINPWQNNFTNLYFNHLSKNNEVRLINPQTDKTFIETIQWSDLVWSQWANECLADISKLSFDATLITHIHSYEILTAPLMKSIRWDKVNGAIFVADHIRYNANQFWPNQLRGVAQTTIYNSVDLSAYPFRNVQPGKNIGFIGYINHKKGVELLLQCIKAAVDIDPAYRLHIAGTFQEKRYDVYMCHMIKQMRLTDHVIFHGWVKNIAEWLKPMNYVISTSPWEGCPLNIIEAMACGVKPLIHNWQGAKTLFPAKCVFSTIDDFKAIVQDRDYRSDEYRAVVEKQFNAQINIAKIETFLSERILQRKVTVRATSEIKPDRAGPGVKIADGSEIQSAARTLNFYQPLGRKVDLTSNRKEFTVDLCRGQRVLHLGCVDSGLMDARMAGNSFLHDQIGRVASKLIGADVDKAGIARLSAMGFEVHHLNVETDGDLLRELSRQVDIIVIPEVIEHLNNVGKALENLKACAFMGDILLSTPNAFSLRAFKTINHYKELVHPDHNCYFSPTTLRTILHKHGFNIKRLVMYYWPTEDPIGQELKAAVTQNPYYAEGMIVTI